MFTLPVPLFVSAALGTVSSLPCCSFRYLESRTLKEDLRPNLRVLESSYTVAWHDVGTQENEQSEQKTVHVRALQV